MNSYNRKSTPIRRLVNHPDVNVRAKALSESVDGMHDVTPNIAQSLQTTSSKALNYLHDQMPKPLSEMIGDAEYEPSKAAQRKWLGSHEVVNDPTSALDHVRHGTLTQDHMNALQQVHPELLDEMRQKVMEHMDPKRVRSLPGSTKMALGLFLGNPVTQSMSPQTILSNQAAFQLPGASPGMGAMKSAGAKDVNVAERSVTKTQALSNE